MRTDILTHADRRQHALDCALQVFIRFGYRKTTMDDVARTADISRQGLYFMFANKEDLFRGAMRKALDDGLVAACARLEDGKLAPGERLVLAFDEWMGRFVGIGRGDASDLFERSGALLGSLLSDYSTVFQEHVAQMLADCALAADEDGAAELAATLYQCAVGCKHCVLTQAEFVARMQVAVRIIAGSRAAGQKV
jgi:AcrR family transcriptional regulator